MRVLSPLAITDSTLYSSSVAETDHPAWVSGTTYAAEARVIRATTHGIYERLIAGAGTTPPEDDEVNWSRVGPTNRWGMFDASPSSLTSATTSISVYCTLAALDAVVLEGVRGTTVQIYDGATGTTLVRTVSVPAIVAPATVARVVISGLSIAAGNRLRILLTGTGTVQIGHCSIGTFADLGETTSVEVGDADYSKITENEWGVLSLQRRNYSARLSVRARIPLASEAATVALLESLTDSVAYWDADSDDDCTAATGIGRDWSMVLREPTAATCSLTVLGLSQDDVLLGPGEAALPSDLGLKTAPVYLYQRAPTAPVGPSQTITYTFAGPVLDGLHGGWQAGIPDGEGPIWIVTAVATGNARSVALRPAQWAAPALMAQEAVNYDVEIESTNGTEFRIGQGTQTLLKAHVFRNDSEVTADIPESWFRWRRVSLFPQPPPNDDATWNTAYASGYRQINVSVDDVAAKATFFLDIVRPD